MPNIFKALASIAGWILFIIGCLGVLLPLLYRVLAGLFTGDVVGIFASMLSLQTGVIALALSVGVMKLRQMLD